MANPAALPRRPPRWLIYLTRGDTPLPPRTRTATEGKFFLSPESLLSAEKNAFPGRIYYSFLSLRCPFCSFPFSSPYPLLIFVANHIAARGQGEREAFSYCLRPGDPNESNSACFSISPSAPPLPIKYPGTSVPPQPPQSPHRASFPFPRGLLGPQQPARSAPAVTTAGRGQKSGATRDHFFFFSLLVYIANSSWKKKIKPTQPPPPKKQTPLANISATPETLRSVISAGGFFSQRPVAGGSQTKGGLRAGPPRPRCPQGPPDPAAPPRVVSGGPGRGAEDPPARFPGAPSPGRRRCLPSPGCAAPRREGSACAAAPQVRFPRGRPRPSRRGTRREGQPSVPAGRAAAAREDIANSTPQHPARRPSRDATEPGPAGSAAPLPSRRHPPIPPPRTHRGRLRCPPPLLPLLVPVLPGAAGPRRAPALAAGPRSRRWLPPSPPRPARLPGP